MHLLTDISTHGRRTMSTMWSLELKKLVVSSAMWNKTEKFCIWNKTDHLWTVFVTTMSIIYFIRSKGPPDKVFFSDNLSYESIRMLELTSFSFSSSMSSLDAIQFLVFTNVFLWARSVTLWMNNPATFTQKYRMTLAKIWKIKKLLIKRLLYINLIVIALNNHFLLFSPKLNTFLFQVFVWDLSILTALSNVINILFRFTCKNR